jgi:hypothetical protein
MNDSDQEENLNIGQESSDDMRPFKSRDASLKPGLQDLFTMQDFNK